MGKEKRMKPYSDDWSRGERKKKDKPGKKHNNQYHTNYTKANKKQDKRDRYKDY